MILEAAYNETLLIWWDAQSPKYLIHFWWGEWVRFVDGSLKCSTCATMQPIQSFACHLIGKLICFQATKLKSNSSGWYKEFFIFFCIRCLHATWITWKKRVRNFTMWTLKSCQKLTETHGLFFSLVICENFGLVYGRWNYTFETTG